ncbi:MAG: Wzz/FepE/Etk N-terminal domain-containing protein [Patescibacteria group bacterium]
MGIREILNLINQKKWLILWLTILGAVLAFDLAVIQKPKYEASSRILVVQKQAEGQDIYTISKSAQYLTGILKEVVYSDSFFDKVILLAPDIGKSGFSDKIKERRKEWEKSVKVSIVRDLGEMKIKVYSSNKDQSEQIDRTITEVLEKEHGFYHGGGDNVQIKVLDYPLVSDQPVSTNLWLATILGGLIGLSAGVFWAAGKKTKNEIKSETSSLEGNNISL